MLSTKKAHFSFHQILAFATVVNLVQLDCVALYYYCLRKDFAFWAKSLRRHPSSSRVYIEKYLIMMSVYQNKDLHLLDQGPNRSRPQV